MSVQTTQDPFIGRKTELIKLKKLYQDKLSQLIVVYGRRRVGKTSLLTHFSRNKNCALKDPV